MILEKDKTHQQFRLSKCQPAEFWAVLQAGWPFPWRCLFSGSNWGWTSCWPIMITSIHGSTRISTFQRWLNLRSRTRAGTSRFSRLAWWARKATTSMNLGRSGYHKCFNFFFNLLLLFTFYLLTLLFLFLFFDPALPVVGNVAEEGVTPVPEGRTNSQGWGLTVDLDWLT